MCQLQEAKCINAVLNGDPFCMPLIEDMLDQVGDCKFLSKIYLSKGFYQVPYRSRQGQGCVIHAIRKILIYSDTFWSSLRMAIF